MGLLDGMKIPCPNCGKEIEKGVGGLQDGLNTCPHCGKQFNAQGVSETFEAAEKEIDDLLRHFDKF